ncbi:MAG: VOC family protein [Erythrobacter sp.]
MTARNTICVWYDREAEYAARFYASVFPDSQEETDRYWNAVIGNGGRESDCGWCKDKWGVKRAFGAMMTMQKLDHAAIEAAIRGEA